MGKKRKKKSRQGDQRRDGQKEEERRGERRERDGELKEDVSGLWYLQSRRRSGELWWSFLGGTFLEKPEDLSDCEPGTRVDVSVVPDVTDVLVSPSSVVTELCDGLFFLLGWGIGGTAVLFFLQHACSLLDSYAGRDEVRRLTSESASAI